MAKFQQNTKQNERGTLCSKTQDATGRKDAASMLGVDTSEVMRQMSFVGGMECASHRSQEVSTSRPSGKDRQFRPPIVPAALTHNATTGPDE